MTHTKSEVHVYVLEATFFGEYGWTSVHATVGGAYKRLAEKVREYDLNGELWELYGHIVSNAEVPSAAGSNGDPVIWGVTRLPLETP